MRSRVLFLSAFSGLLLLSGCGAITGKEVARLSIDSLSTPELLDMAEATVALQQGDVVAFWSDMDVAYDGEPELRFRVRILRGDTDLTLLEIDPMEMNVTMGENKTTVGEHTEWSFTGRNQEWTSPANGSYTFKAILTAAEGSVVRINKADLVLKQ